MRMHVCSDERLGLRSQAQACLPTCTTDVCALLLRDYALELWHASCNREIAERLIQLILRGAMERSVTVDTATTACTGVGSMRPQPWRR